MTDIRRVKRCIIIIIIILHNSFAVHAGTLCFCVFMYAPGINVPSRCPLSIYTLRHCKLTNVILRRARCSVYRNQHEYNILPACSTVAFLSFFRTDYMDSPDCLPQTGLLLSIGLSVFLIFSFSVFTLFVVGSVR